MNWFCWHKWPLYSETKPVKQLFTWKGPEFYAWFKCYKCKKEKLKACDEYGQRQ